MLPFWNEALAPAIRSGQRVLIAAHGNSIRALVKYLDDIGDAEIVGVNIPNGIPLVYELDDDLKPIRSYYLGDAEAAALAAAAVADQGIATPDPARRARAGSRRRSSCASARRSWRPLGSGGSSADADLEPFGHHDLPAPRSRGWCRRHRRPRR